MAKILILVEGEKTDFRLMKRLFDIYKISKKYTIVSYNTNIYNLYDDMFLNNNPDEMDLLQILKEREKDPRKKSIFNEKYSDKLLIFDLEPHDPKFSPDKIREMSEYFVESSDMGKLYINYPMVEAFYHMENIPDPAYNSRYASMEELQAGKYKERVNRENRDRSYSKFAIDKAECNTVIKQNIEKGFWLCGIDDPQEPLPKSDNILSVQLDTIKKEQRMAVLCTCAFYIVDYNPKLIE